MWRAWVVAIVGCYAPHAPERVPCTSTDRCPIGQTCNAGFCNGELPLDARHVTNDVRDPDAAPTVLDAIAGLVFLEPCSPHSVTSKQCACGTRTNSTNVDGVAGTTYVATIRIRGVLETAQYVGGTPGPGGWYENGQTTSLSNTTFMIEVSSPPALYWINSGPQLVTTVIDYTTTLRVDGQANVLFRIDPQDGKCNTNLGPNNAPLAIPGVATTPDPYDGQFARLDLLSVGIASD